MKTTNNTVRAGQPSQPKRISQKLAVAAFAIGSIFAVAAPAQASDRTADRIAGTLVGAGIGAIVGQHIGGHDGAKVGGLIGATIGLTATSHNTHRAHRPHTSHQPYYGNRHAHRPVVNHHAQREQRLAQKYKRGYNRGFDDGKHAYRSYTVSSAHDVQFDLSQRHPRFAHGYRVGFRDGLAKARKIERRRIRNQRRHSNERRYHPNHSHGKVGHVTKPVYREHVQHPRHRHGNKQGHVHKYQNGFGHGSSVYNRINNRP